MLQEPQDVDCAFVFDLLQHAVYDNVGACPAHAGAAREGDTQLLPRTRKTTVWVAHELRNHLVV